MSLPTKLVEVDKISNKEELRAIYPGTSSELEWHMDLEDRLITVISGNGWKFQFDKQLPFLLEDNISFLIKKDTWHRVISGNKELKVLINYL